MPSIDDSPQSAAGVAPVPPITLLADESPLRALPARLDRSQMLVLDGISVSIDMTMVAYRQLQAALLEHTQSTNPPLRRAATIYAVMNAWTIVDAANRLRILVRRLHNLRHGPAVRAFLAGVGPVEPLRNAVQHLDGEIRRLLNEGHPIWGSLSWAYIASPDAKQIQVGLLMPGTLAPSYELPLVNPLGREIEIPIGLVTLTAAGQTVSLSEVVAAVRRFAGRLERAAAAAFLALPPDGVGVQASFDLQVD